MVICFGSDLSKLDQTGSNLIKFGFFTYQKMLIWKVVTFIMRIIMVNFFWLDQMKSVQNGSKWIKLDQISISHLSKNVNIKSCHIYHENNHGQLFLARSDEICPNWIKMDQTWSNLEFSPIKKVTIKSCYIYHKNKHGQLFWTRSGYICPNGSKWIKLDPKQLLKW